MSESDHSNDKSYPLESPAEPVEGPAPAAGATPAPPAAGGSSNVVEPAPGRVAAAAGGGAAPGAPTGLMPYVEGSVERALMEQATGEVLSEEEARAKSIAASVEAKLGSEASDTEKSVEGAIQGWLHDRMRNSPVSMFTDAWNHLVTELDSLRDYIVKEL